VQSDAVEGSFVAFGELLLRLEAPGHARIVQAERFGARYTGAEANLAVALAQLGLRAAAVSKVPDNEVGQACVDYLRRFGVDTTHVARGGPRLGLLYLETGSPPRPTKVVYDRAGSSFATSTPQDYDWAEILAGARWLHFSGTAAAGGAGVAAALGEGVAEARRCGVTVSCDLNYRAKLWSAAEAAAALAPLLGQVEVLTGAGEDAARLFGVEVDGAHLDENGLTAAGFGHVARSLQARFGFACVAGVLREEHGGVAPRLRGAIVDRQAELVLGRAFAQPVAVDRIGAGDAFSAGVVHGLASGHEPDRTADFATALYCLAQSIEGDFALVSAAEVQALAAAAGSGTIPRVDR
jgi:2-dehydro-3-deoxygluconokinase